MLSRRNAFREMLADKFSQSELQHIDPQQPTGIMPLTSQAVG